MELQNQAGKCLKLPEGWVSVGAGVGAYDGSLVKAGIDADERLIEDAESVDQEVLKL